MLISIIVPIYNTEKYLPECIDSILAQTYTDFELLLVDDGSTDLSGKICDEYAHRDSRIRVFHKENGGVSSARNVGLENAKGEWVCFVDSDDTIPKDAMQCIYQNIDNDIDLIFSKYRVTDNTGNLLREYNAINCNSVLTLKTFLKIMYAPKIEDYQGYTWNKLFRRSVIVGYRLRFDEKVYFNEDRLFVVRYACASGKSVKYLNQLTYTYLLNLNGTIASLNNGYNKKFVTDFDALILMKEEIEKLPFGRDLRWLTIGGIRNSYDWNLRMMMRAGEYDRRNHWHMTWGMIRSGALMPHLKDAIRPFVNMFFPILYI